MNATFALIAIIALGAIGLMNYLRTPPTPTETNPSAVSVRPTVQQLSVGELPQNVFVLDVRESWEYAQGHIPESTLIPLGQLANRLDELPKGEPIYVICRSGNRSQQAAELLVASGFREVYNVQGGMLAYERAGLPVAR
jgi:rhodanese-related sulfurtransferase